jgi:hypothetical protein
MAFTTADAPQPRLGPHREVRYVPSGCARRPVQQFLYLVLLSMGDIRYVGPLDGAEFPPERATQTALKRGQGACMAGENFDACDLETITKVGPLGLLKSVENGRTMVLARIITDAKAKITSTPVKFDPKMMIKQHMHEHRQQP